MCVKTMKGSEKKAADEPRRGVISSAWSGTPLTFCSVCEVMVVFYCQARLKLGCLVRPMS